MSKVTLQIPMDKSLKALAEKTALEYGFSSLQEALRVFMAQFASKKLTIGFSQVQNEVLTDAQEKILTKKYHQAKEEVKQGKGFSARSINEMMSQLHK